MNKFTKDDLNVILFAVSSLMDSTTEELANMSADDEERAGFEAQLSSCEAVIDKLRGFTDFG